jgi:hypothetical protein
VAKIYHPGEGRDPCNAGGDDMPPPFVKLGELI